MTSLFLNPDKGSSVHVSRGGAALLLKTLLLLAAVMTSGLSAFAQLHSGRITGLVTDSSGAVIPKAPVTITNVETGVISNLVTDSAGLYDAPDLLPGHYSVAVSRTGFRTESKVGIALSLGQTLTINFTRMVVSYIYELPFGKGKKFLSTSNPVADAFLGGWQLNGITSAQTGSPFTPRLSNGSADINSGVSGLVRPNLVGDPNLPAGQQTIQHWYNIAAFAAPGQGGTPPYTFGNLGRNTLRGPNLVNFDFSLFKNFALTERLKLQFRSEFFNIFNRPNFGLPDPNIDLSTAGIITSAQPPRLIQFALKLLF